MNRTLIALALVAFVVLSLLFPPSAAKSPEAPAPEKDMQDIVRPLLPIVARLSIVDRLYLQHIYSSSARVLRADVTAKEPSITTTAKARAVHMAVLVYVWKGLAGNSPEKYTGLDAAIETAFVTVAGTQEVALTPERSERLAELYDAIAWAGLGKDG